MENDSNEFVTAAQEFVKIITAWRMFRHVDDLGNEIEKIESQKPSYSLKIDGPNRPSDRGPDTLWEKYLKGRTDHGSGRY